MCHGEKKKQKQKTEWTTKTEERGKEREDGLRWGSGVFSEWIMAFAINKPDRGGNGMIASHHPLLLSSSSLSPSCAAPLPSIRLYLLWPVLCRPHLLFYYLPPLPPETYFCPAGGAPSFIKYRRGGGKGIGKGKSCMCSGSRMRDGGQRGWRERREGNGYAVVCCSQHQKSFWERKLKSS